MLKFLLGVFVGAVATAQYQRRYKYSSASSGSGRVDEFSTAAQNVPADLTLNTGDGTPGSRLRATDDLRMTT